MELEVYIIWRQLMLMSLTDDRLPHDDYRSPFLEKNREKVRELGESLNKIGGFPLMVKMCESMPLWDQRELECAWHGIGDWLA